MRIALDATYSIDPHPSGIAVYSRELLQGLATAHPDDEFLHCYRIKPFLRETHGAHTSNVRRRLLIPPLPTIHSDVFHALNQRVDRRPAKHVISTFHDLFVMTGEYSSPDFRARFTQQAKRAAANSDLIIAVSEFTANQITSLLDISRSRIRVVHHGIRPPKQLTPQGREKMVLFVGALQARKNVTRLIEAFEQLPSDWTLTLVGAETGFGAADILERILRSGASERIRTAGYVNADDLDALYSRASIFAFPSLDEGFGMPVLEAMARGVPVLTSNHSALAEVAGSAALLIDPYQSEQIAEALKRLASDETLRAELIQAGTARARKFTWDSAVSKTYNVYQELAA